MPALEASASVDDTDMKILEKQLKRQPVGAVAVLSRCKFDYPQVIQSEVFIKGIPFPTLFWLTCPLKIKAVSGIEGQGWSDHFKKKIEADLYLKERLSLAHENYRCLRRKAHASIEHDADHEVFSTGVGGVRDIEGVKCLHAHYAHYLVTGNNPLGEIVDKLISGIECERQCDER
jgi:hypothetical protein